MVSGQQLLADGHRGGTGPPVADRHVELVPAQPEDGADHRGGAGGEDLGDRPGAAAFQQLRQTDGALHQGQAVLGAQGQDAVAGDALQDGARPRE